MLASRTDIMKWIMEPGLPRAAGSNRNSRFRQNRMVSSTGASLRSIAAATACIDPLLTYDMGRYDPSNEQAGCEIRWLSILRTSFGL
jgi:hypothetical protein